MKEHYRTGQIIPALAPLPTLPEGWNIVIRNEDAPSYHLRILPEGILEVRAPYGTDITSCLQRHQGWIQRQIERTVQIAKEERGQEDLLLLDGSYRTLTNGSSCEIGRSTVIYNSPRHLKEALIKRLHKDLDERVARGILRTGRSPHRITIRMQRSRWASCSGRGNLNFNLTMLALPPILREYIVLHEMVHLLVPNHSREFWEVLEKFCPDYLRQKQELKRYHVLVERNRIWNVLRTIR